MKKVYSFTQSVMNGTVTKETSVALFATRELAEQTLADIKADNAKRDLGAFASATAGYRKPMCMKPRTRFRSINSKDKAIW